MDSMSITLDEYKAAYEAASNAVGAVQSIHSSLCNFFASSSRNDLGSLLTLLEQCRPVLESAERAVDDHLSPARIELIERTLAREDNLAAVKVDENSFSSGHAAAKTLIYSVLAEFNNVSLAATLLKAVHANLHLWLDDLAESLGELSTAIRREYLIVSESGTKSLEVLGEVEGRPEKSSVHQQRVNFHEAEKDQFAEKHGHEFDEHNTKDTSLMAAAYVAKYPQDPITYEQFGESEYELKRKTRKRSAK